MRTPEQILRDALAAQARLGVDEGITWGVAYRAVALAQAEAAREVLEAACRSQCSTCGVGGWVLVEDTTGWMHETLIQPLYRRSCEAADIRADFARRHPEVKS